MGAYQPSLSHQLELFAPTSLSSSRVNAVGKHFSAKLESSAYPSLRSLANTPRLGSSEGLDVEGTRQNHGEIPSLAMACHTVCTILPFSSFALLPLMGESKAAPLSMQNKTNLSLRYSAHETVDTRIGRKSA